MSPLTQSLVELTRLFDHLGLTYALMGGLAVRVYGMPRATYDIDFTLAIRREDLGGLYRAVEDLGYTVPEAYATGWVDEWPACRSSSFASTSRTMGSTSTFSWQSHPINMSYWLGDGAKRRTGRRVPH
jgi:hypothetical protein